MESTVCTEFGSRELEVIYAALDHYQQYISDYADGYPVIGLDGGDLSWVIQRVENTKDRVERIIALGKALKDAVH